MSKDRVGKMKKILITGAAGFISSHLVEACMQRGYAVKAFVRYNSKNNWGWLDSIEHNDKLEIVSGDIRDYDSIYNSLKGCDAIFHLAALIGIPYSYVSPLAYVKTNIEGTYNVLEAARQLNLKNIVITSTSETYGTAQYIPIDEKHPAVGQSPYSATKIAADQLALSYFYSFNLPVKIARPFNTYGPRQSARAIIPTIITQLLDGSKKLELGNIEPTRDFTYVKDTVNAFIEIAETDKLIGEATNIGSNKEISIEELVCLIASLMGKNIEIIADDKRIRPKRGEVDQLNCDNTKIKKYTKWQPNYALENGLQETINWISDNRSLYKTGVYNV